MGDGIGPLFNGQKYGREAKQPCLRDFIDRVDLNCFATIHLAAQGAACRVHLKQS